MRQQLDNGLILRSLGDGTQQDRDNLRQFYVDVFVGEYGEEDEVLGLWVPDLLNEHHPTVVDDDIFVVVDPADNERIVSASLLIPQTWTYAGINVPTGQIELVGTLPSYRGKGLIRALFDAIHARSENMGHMLQSIGGIPNYYRQYEYAMAVDLGVGGVIPFGIIKDLKPDQKPSFSLRLATVEDIPQMVAYAQQFCSQYLLSVKHDAAHYEFEMLHRNLDSHVARVYMMIVDADGESVGYVGVRSKARDGTLDLYHYAVGDTTSYLATINDVLRGLRDYALNNISKDAPQTPYAVRYESGLSPVMTPLLRGNHSINLISNDYAWYIRVPNLIDFIQHIRPVLEERLEGSLANCYTGELQIGFYRKQGLYMRFEKGKLVEVADKPATLAHADARFPEYTFYNLLFGHRSLPELRVGHIDVVYGPRADALLSILFPKQPSWLINQA